MLRRRSLETPPVVLPSSLWWVKLILWTIRVNKKDEKYSAAASRSGHQFMPFVLDIFGNVFEDSKEMMYQIFLKRLSMINMISLSLRLNSSLQGSSDFG